MATRIEGVAVVEGSHRTGLAAHRETVVNGRSHASWWRSRTMEPRRFDTLTRSVATSVNRRAALRRMGRLATSALVMLGGLSRTRQTAVAHHCTYEGCGCATGTQHPCGSGLVCCASSPGTPGGAGVCTRRGQCGESCVGQSGACPGYCNWGDGCSGCCTGYCNGRGKCDTPPNLNATCTGGTQQACLYGLLCCPYVPGLAGGAGTCEYAC